MGGHEHRAAFRPECILMFSGGRDSTLAALSLAQGEGALGLVTVTGEHLTGIDSVKKRLDQLKVKLPSGSRWIQIRQPSGLSAFESPLEQTCLPCQHDYAYAGAVAAKKFGATSLAFGYASYQSAWPEQSPLATAALSSVLAEAGIKLELPVYGLVSRDDAIAQLSAADLDSRALEQKCLKQIFNKPLEASALAEYVESWAEALRRSLTVATEIEVLDETEF